MYINKMLYVYLFKHMYRAFYIQVYKLFCLNYPYIYQAKHEFILMFKIASKTPNFILVNKSSIFKIYDMT